MAIFRLRPIPRRALFAAMLGAAYALLILPAPGTIIGVSLAGITWFVLSLSLLFLMPLAWHMYTGWAILWIVYRGIIFVRSGDVMLLAFDLSLPIASLALLMTSGYLPAARAATRA